MDYRNGKESQIFWQCSHNNNHNNKTRRGEEIKNKHNKSKRTKKTKSKNWSIMDYWNPKESPRIAESLQASRRIADLFQAQVEQVEQAEQAEQVEKVEKGP